MPYIQLTLGAGRTAAQKDRVLRALSRAAADALSIDEETVRVWIVEVPAEEVLVGGRTLAEKRATRRTSDEGVGT